MSTNPPHSIPPRETGVLLLQIDGLSQFQFERAVKSGRMPFLKSLMEKRDHALKTFYPGQPSCTPAVQAEIHYGAQCATPAFSFYDSEAKQEVRMYDAEWASRIAQESEEQGDGLLEGGSSYANIYTGGAEKAKYCGELNTFSYWVSELSILRLLRLAVKNPTDTMRLAKLLVAELGVGIYDAVRGILTRGDLAAELTFIPARLAVAITLREAIRGEVIEDLNNGLPIIHANFFGYDEAAHRRGPHSRFAHWTLKGIDKTIKKLYRAAENSDARNYRIIVFSDHGQEHTVPYHEEAGKTLAEATKDIFSKKEGFKLSPSSSLDAFMERSKSIVETNFDTNEDSTRESTRWIHLQAMGPVAHCYVDEGLRAEEKAGWAETFIQEANIPTVLFERDDGSIACHMEGESGGLDVLKKRLDSRGHEFAEETIDDLRILAQSKYAGDLIFLGWRPAGKPLTFADERGAHAGPGAEECRGFVMLPNTVNWQPQAMRPRDLREIAMQQLGRIDTKRDQIESAPVPSLDSLRVMSYNVHGGVGSDRRRSVSRLAKVMRESEADVICFQEAFENPDNPTHSLKRSLEGVWDTPAHYAFQPLHTKRGTQYGLAIASRYPFRIKKSAAFDLEDPRVANREPRGAIWIEITPESGNCINIVNTHLGLSSLERELQSRSLTSDQWLGTLEDYDQLAVCGDFNAGPKGLAYLAFANKLADSQLLANRGRAKPSFVSWAPFRRIDHIFTSPQIQVPAAGVLRSSLLKRASDHLPVFADMKLV
ncbi:endonuclease/exonuclease/phosphatase family protein [Pelagicoccus albus]|uniref:Endonuclease/exonuclease/phosphatase family protein n=1 Tax=Pelagicoccus albus TaxID=415222 RepID=A0A7X1EA25_9BACT|nr:endonuclease/exonuclease/phosphatase family protein [Pelagicoccus albus]MBC2608059.1 endonuclease/exonuclease/phosphatase family protein [Pelagicoccus albus]